MHSETEESMSSRRRSWLAAGLALLVGCAASSDVMTQAPPPSPEPVADRATVYFLLPSNSLHGTRFQVWDRTELLGLALPASYFVAHCVPGNHLFIVTGENRVAVDAELEAGKRYYVLLGTDGGYVRARAEATPVRRGTELWDKVEQIQQGLVYLEPVEAGRREWQERRRADAAELVAWFATAPDREKHLQHLAASDGR
jgi:hypothetical protein